MCAESPKTSFESANHFISQLEQIFERLRGIGRETFDVLGEEQAGFFINLMDDFLTIQSAISHMYPTEELVDSLVSLRLAGLFKDVYWLELLFLAGNYPMLYRNLRFTWEMFFRAYYVDTCVKLTEKDPEPSELTIDGKTEWLGQHEIEMSGWQFVKRVLHKLLPQAANAEVEKYYWSWWDRLNGYVHPSKVLLERMVLRESILLIRDSFDAEWAVDAIQTATEVFDLVWLAVLRRFQGSVGLVGQEGLRVEYPIVTACLRNLRAPDLACPQ